MYKKLCTTEPKELKQILSYIIIVLNLEAWLHLEALLLSAKCNDLAFFGSVAQSLSAFYNEDG